MVNLKYAIKYYALNDTLLKYTQRTYNEYNNNICNTLYIIILL